VTSSGEFSKAKVQLTSDGDSDKIAMKIIEGQFPKTASQLKMEHPAERMSRNHK